MSEYIQITTTTDTQEEATRIAKLLVQSRLVACAQVSGPIQSIYWWKDKVESAQEWVCSAKTHRQRYEEVEAAIHQAHSYDVPEVIALPIVAGSTQYLRWVDQHVASTKHHE